MPFSLKNIQIWKSIADFINRKTPDMSEDLHFVRADVVVRSGRVAHTYTDEAGDTKTCYSNYRIYSDNFCIQWGNGTPSNKTNNEQTIILGVPFSSQSYYVLVTSRGGISKPTTVQTCGVSTNTQISTKFTVWVSDGKGTNFDWLALGSVENPNVGEL